VSGFVYSISNLRPGSNYPPESGNISEPDQFLRTLLIPDDTRIQADRIFVDGDVIIGSHASLDYGITGNMVVLGEGVHIGGGLKAGNDVRIDMWSRIGSSVDVARNAYLGEFTKIEGRLTVKGDLDVGKNVKIKGGFEAKGWVVVRSPVPVIFFLYLYIMEMMRLGKDEEVEKALEELFGCYETCPEIDEKVLIVPPDAKISIEVIDVPGKAVIGNRCMLTGNIHADSLEIGEDLTLQGSLHSGGKTTIGDRATVHGNLYSGGQVRIGKDSYIIGEIKANSVFLHESSKVEGRIKAPFGVTFLRDREIDEPGKARNVFSLSESGAETGEEISVTEAVAGLKAEVDDISEEISGEFLEDRAVQPMEIIEIETLLSSGTETSRVETRGPDAPGMDATRVSEKSASGLRTPGIIRKGGGNLSPGKIRNYSGSRNRRRRLSKKKKPGPVKVFQIK